MEQKFTIPWVDFNDKRFISFGRHEIRDLTKAEKTAQNVGKPLADLSIGPFASHRLLDRERSEFYPIDDCFVQYILDDTNLDFWNPRNKPDKESVIIWNHNMSADYTSTINWFGEKPKPVIFRPVAKVPLVPAESPKEKVAKALNLHSMVEEKEYNESDIETVKQRFFMDKKGEYYLLYKICEHTFIFINSWNDFIRVSISIDKEDNPTAYRLKTYTHYNYEYIRTELDMLINMRKQYFQRLYGE